MATTVELDDRGIVVSCAACGKKNRLAYARLGEAVRCGQCKQPLTAPSVPIELHSSADFDRLVAASSLPVVVDYWAPWCGPCRMVGPILDQLAAESEGRYRIAKLNVDDNQQTAARFQIASIPTMLIFKDGQLIDRLIGAQPKEVITQHLQMALRSAA
jgi:thioredoxin